MEYITAARIIRLKKERQSVTIHPRKKIVVVSGWKYFRITPVELKKLKKQYA